MNPEPTPAPLSARLLNLVGASAAFTAMTVGAHIAMNGVRNVEAADAINTVAVIAGFWFVTAVWWLTAVCWTAEHLGRQPQQPAPTRPPVVAARDPELIDDYRRGRHAQQPRWPDHDTTQAAA